MLLRQPTHSPQSCISAQKHLWHLTSPSPPAPTPASPEVHPWDGPLAQCERSPGFLVQYPSGCVLLKVEPPPQWQDFSHSRSTAGSELAPDIPQSLAEGSLWQRAPCGYTTVVCRCCFRLFRFWLGSRHVNTSSTFYWNQRNFDSSTVKTVFVLGVNWRVRASPRNISQHNKKRRQFN